MAKTNFGIVGAEALTKSGVESPFLVLQNQTLASSITLYKTLVFYKTITNSNSASEANTIYNNLLVRVGTFPRIIDQIMSKIPWGQDLSGTSGKAFCYDLDTYPTYNFSNGVIGSISSIVPNFGSIRDGCSGAKKWRYMIWQSSGNSNSDYIYVFVSWALFQSAATTKQIFRSGGTTSGLSIPISQSVIYSSDPNLTHPLTVPPASMGYFNTYAPPGDASGTATGTVIEIPFPTTESPRPSLISINTASTAIVNFTDSVPSIGYTECNYV